MKKSAERLLSAFRAWIGPFLKLGPARLIVLGACLASCCAGYLIIAPGSPVRYRSPLEGLEVGKVAERDFVAERSVTYVDEALTQEAVQARLAGVTAVFSVDEAASQAVLQRFDGFAKLFDELRSQGDSAELIAQRLREGYPGAFSLEEAKAVAAEGELGLAQARPFLAETLASGVFAIPTKGLESFNPERVELRLWREGRLVAEELPLRNAVTLSSWPDALAQSSRLGLGSRAYRAERAIIKAFLAENVFYDRDISEKRLEAARQSVQPVMKRIERGDKVIKRGYVVDAEQLSRLKALEGTRAKFDAAGLFGAIAYTLILFALCAVLVSPGVSGRDLDRGAFFLLAISGSVYFILATAFSRFQSFPAAMPFALILPTGLVAMLLAILYDGRLSILFGVSIALSLLLVSGMDALPSVFALLSCAFATLSVGKAEKRIDLVRAGLYLALFQALALLVLNLLSGRLEGLFSSLFWAGFNGFFCGVLALGFLPLLETALNAPTRFRLMELSDLNSPLLKRLLTQAPGTYAHSVMVAALAESACRDVGANALLARVAAYYHDIGKMDQSGYFIENQSSHNKHDDIKPRLSATVIRSHVKLGVEKARSMGLPDEVVDIISEHHGNSLIVWFYNQALKAEGQVDRDDFSYPGRPPRSRESAIVMLADTVEAASRTLKKPTMAKLIQFIHEMTMEKFNNGLLSDSELSMRDLKAIEASFVRILAGHYHSRIEYPKMGKPGLGEGAKEGE